MSGNDELRVGEVARYQQPNWRKVNGEWVSNPSEHEAVVTKIEESYVEFDRFVLPRKQVWAISTGGDHEIHEPTVILKSQEEIAIIDHNNARYAQLQKLRLGQPNTYNETSYR